MMWMSLWHRTPNRNWSRLLRMCFRFRMYLCSLPGGRLMLRNALHLGIHDQAFRTLNSFVWLVDPLSSEMSTRSLLLNLKHRGWLIGCRLLNVRGIYLFLGIKDVHAEVVQDSNTLGALVHTSFLKRKSMKMIWLNFAVQSCVACFDEITTTTSPIRHCIFHCLRRQVWILFSAESWMVWRLFGESWGVLAGLTPFVFFLIRRLCQMWMDP